MTADTSCHWVDEHLAAYLFDDLDSESGRKLEAHARTCAACAAEIAGHRQVERLVQAVYRERLDTARHAKQARATAATSPAPAAAFWTPVATAWKTHPVWVGAGTLAAVAVLVIGISVGGASVLTPRTTTGPLGESALAEPEKAGESAAVERAKPEDAVSSRVDDTRVANAELEPGPDGRDFSLEDPAGYLHSLEDFRGSAVAIGVLRSADFEAFRETYERFREIPDLRFIGVPAEQGELVPGVPSMRNRGNSVLETSPGGFVLLDSDGRVTGRGEISDPAFASSVQRWIESDFTLVPVE